MDFQMKYELKQQTPIIHFQHDQNGATLRATEVKPKFDKFIIKKMGGINNVPKGWLIKETNALNYKMRITATGEPEKSKTIELALELKKEKELLKKNNIREKSDRQKNLESSLRSAINEMYFGNMVSDREKNYQEAVQKTYKETVFYREDKSIELAITCFIEGLREIIEKTIEEFFYVHNFGTRQSKGFGSFIINKKDRQEPIKLLSECGYRFFYAEIKEQNIEHSSMMNHAKNIYAVMKGGYNLTGWKWDSRSNKGRYKSPEKYLKGYIQKQFLLDFYDNDTGSDKAFIKSNKEFNENFNKLYNGVYPENRKGKPREYEYNNYLFVRALLGLADHYEFRDDLRDSKKGNVEIFCLGEKEFEIERFKSPITIKIIDNKIVFLFGSFDEICKKTFYFSPNGISNKSDFDKKSYQEKKDIIEKRQDFIKIQTPESFNDADIVKFINRFADYFNSKKADLINFRNVRNGNQFSETPISKSRYINLIVPKHIKEVR